MEKDMKLLGIGLFWDDLAVGDRFRTVAARSPKPTW